MIKRATIGTLLVVDNSLAHIFVERHREGFVVFIAKCGILIFANFCRHLLVEVPANFVNQLVALWIIFAQSHTKFAINPCINVRLNVFVWQHKLVGLRDWRNPITGAIEQVPVGIDPGFDYHPGTTGRSAAFEAMVKAKLGKMSTEVAKAAEAAGVLFPKVAKEVAGQDTWQTLGLADLRQMRPSMAAPDLLTAAESVEDAVNVLRSALGVPVNGARFVETPAGLVTIFDKLLTHVVEKRLDRRERFGAFVLPTLQQPDEVWETAYDDATTRRRFIKLFSDSKYDLLVIVREGPDGAVLWNVLNRGRKAMNTMRTGRLVHGHGRTVGGDVG